MPKRKRVVSKAKKKKRKYKIQGNIERELDNSIKEKAEYHKKKDNCHDISNYTNLYELNKLFIEEGYYKTNLTSHDIIQKKITSNGNCFYNAISYYYHFTEEYSDNYRKLEYSVAQTSIKEIKEFFESNNEDSNLNEKEREEKALNYIKNIQNDGIWAGDIEINTTAKILEINILCYTQNEN